jgi:arylsulfatase A-like enzyme
MMLALDRAVGRVLDALAANGLAENTLVLFTSDNGGANYVGLPDLNKPYRGWKMTFFEGGVHMPFFAKWPRVLPRGATNAAPVAHFDVFATAAAAAGAPLPSDRVIDGVDLVPFATGARAGVPHEALFWRSGHYRVVRAGDWKLQRSERPPKVWLFDLAHDPTEQHDLSQVEPARVAELTALLDAHDATQSPPLWPSLVEGVIRIDPPLGAPTSPDDEYVYWAN